MAQVVRTYAPNPLPATATPGTSAWVIVANDGSTYNTLALLLAAGKKPYPGLTRGAKIHSCLIRSLTAAGAAGSGVLFKRDVTVAPAAIDNADNEVGGSDQQISVDCPFKTIWVYALSSSDRVKFDGRY